MTLQLSLRNPKRSEACGKNKGNMAFDFSTRDVQVTCTTFNEECKSKNRMAHCGSRSVRHAVEQMKCLANQQNKARKCP